MTSPTTASDGPALPPEAVPRWMTPLLATACALIVANLYYAQPLAGPISASLGLSTAGAGLIVTMTQVGYAAGLLFIVPLGDVLENRRLVCTLTGLVALAVLGAAAAPGAGFFLAASLLTGLGAVGIQILVPFAAHLAPEARRGRTLGNVLSGIMLGIMLSRPVSSLVAEFLSWRAVFTGSAAVMVALAVLLLRALPPRRPAVRLGYGALLASMGRLVRTTPVLRRRALYQACMFGAFSLFWTTVPLLLAGPLYRLSQGGIALFALAGVAGAVAAPIAGRVADRGWGRAATGFAMALVGLSFGLDRLATPGTPLGLGLLAAGGISLDFGVTACLVVGQRAIFALGEEVRSRLNGLFMAFFFAGGALGSAAGAWAYAEGGWPLASALGAALPALGLLTYATEWLGRE